MAGKRFQSVAATDLPADRAFVVHFGVGPRPRARFTGRVEHLVSGAVAHFTSLRGLLAFVASRLDPPEPHRSPSKGDYSC